MILWVIAGGGFPHHFKEIKTTNVTKNGVPTDGKIILDANGIESKAFYVQDGTAITYLHRAGIKTAIISGRESKVVE
ncbi:hypothetical protein LCGC14_2909600, partial [marine sediment metagenome]